MKPLINYNKLKNEFSALAKSYAAQEPFAHAVIDDFIRPEALASIIDAFPVIESKSSAHKTYGLHDGKAAQLNKRWLAMEVKTPLLIRQLYRELQSADFLSLLELMTNIKGLVVDPHMLGGGVHETLPGGYLKVHADFNVHPEFYLYRRLNLLIYLNRDWQPEWKGDLQLWDTTGERCVKTIAPIAGRAVIFSTSSCSFHGHPEPLACPEGHSRKSIALYYFNQHRPPEGEQKMHMTLWRTS